MKDGTCGVPLKGFVGLKAKVYTFIAKENHECKKAKGINKNVVDDELKYEGYKTFSSTDNIWEVKWTDFRAKIII